MLTDQQKLIYIRLLFQSFVLVISHSETFGLITTTHLSHPLRDGFNSTTNSFFFFFYKNRIGIDKHTKDDMPLNKES